MLPSLSRLAVNNQCHPCAPVDALLAKWSDRSKVLSNEQLEQIPEDFRGSRTECGICWRNLAEQAPGGGKAVIVAVDKSISCGHPFHEECLVSWFDVKVRDFGALTCPICTQPFVDAKIDMLYNRIDGSRPRLDPPMTTAGGHVWRPLPWPLRYGHDGNAVLELIPGELRLQVPKEELDSWQEYTYEIFKERYHVDDLDYGKWLELLVKTDTRRSLWVKYYVLRWELWELKEGMLDVYDASKRNATELLKDVRDAREEGNTWNQILLALTLGRVPEGTPRRL